MAVPNPVSPWAFLLVLALPGVWLAGRSLAWLALDDRWTARIVSPGLALAVWLLAMHAAGLVSGSFHSALTAGTLTIAAAGLSGFALARRGRIRPPPDGGRPSAWMWVGAALAILAIAPAALGWAFHDELFYNGHMSMTAAMQNGGYPPRNLTFPEYPLRYHYGFALLTAAFTSLFRIPISVGIDAITLVLWGYVFVLLWVIGDAWIGRGRGWLTAVLTLFGGGVPFVFCALDGEPAAWAMTGFCRVAGTELNAPIASYFFQHPWTVGLPVALVLVLVSAGGSRPAVRYPVLGLLLVALSICQFVLFAALGAAVVVAEAARPGHPADRLRRGLSMLATAAAALLAAREAGGFFAPRPAGSGSMLLADPGVAGGWLDTLAWHVGTYGLLLPLGLAGLFALRKSRLLLACLAGGGIGIINVLRYPHSWDIIKFGAVAAIALSIAGSAAVARLMDRRPPVRGGLLGGAALAGATLAGILFLSAFATRRPGIPADIFTPKPAPIAAADAAAIGWLRTRVEPADLVYRDFAHSLPYAQYGGLAQPWLDVAVGRFGMPEAVIGERERLLVTLPAEPGLWLAQRLRWLVLSPEDTALNARADRWLREGLARERARFGELRIVELGRPR